MTQDVAVDLVLHVETALDQPIEEVWPYILNWTLWIDANDFVQHRVSGTPDTEGEIRRITQFDGAGRVAETFFIKVARIISGRQLVYKVLSPTYMYDAATGASTEVPTTGYEVINVHKEGDRTIVALDVFLDLRPDGVTEEQANSMPAALRAEIEHKWHGKYFPKLKALLAK
jgi:hypothetical protein